jgi:hypothetical protein
MALIRQEWIIYGGKLVVVNHLTGVSKDTVPIVLDLLKDVPPGHAGLGGTNAGNKHADAENFLNGDIMSRIRKHAGEEYKFANLIGIIVINNYDQLGDLRVLGDEFREEIELCGSPSIESDLVVALQRKGLSPDTLSNVNSYGANVVSKLLP